MKNTFMASSWSSLVPLGLGILFPWLMLLLLLLLLLLVFGEKQVFKQLPRWFWVGFGFVLVCFVLVGFVFFF